MNSQTFLRNSLIFGVFLVPIIPLIITNSMFFPFITGKNFFFRILVEVLLAGWVVLALWDPQYRPRFSWLLGIFAVFVSVIALADILGENPFKSFWSNFERMEGLITLVHLFAYFLVAGALLNTKSLWAKFLNTSIGVSVVIGVYGLFQIAGLVTINQGGVRLDGTFGNASYLGIYMLFHIFLTLLMLALSQGSRWVKGAYGIIAILQIVILYHTATRGAILGLVGGMFVTLLLLALFSKNNKGLRKGALISVVALAVVVGGFMFARGSSFVKDSPVLSRLASISISEGDPRFAVWNMGYQAFKERPILGWGQENFIFAFNKYYDPNIFDQEPWFDRVHNIFFDWLVAGGILGLVSYLGLYFFSLYYLWFGGKSVFSTAEKSIFTGVFAGYFFHNLFVFDNIASYVLFFSVLAYIHHRVVSGKEAPSYSEYSRSSINRLVVPAVSVLLIASVYLLNVPGVLQARALLKALSPNQEGVSKNLELFRDALEYDTFGNQEIREQLMRGSISFVSRQDVELNDKQELFSLTVGEYKKQIEQSPNDARHHLFLGTVYRAYGQNDLALESVSRALELSPQKQVILFEIGLNQLNKNNTSAALSTFKKAFELAPEYTSARIFYAVSAIYAGDRALADSLLNDGFGTLIVSDDLLVQAYFDVGLLDRVIAIWESRVNSQPNNAQFHISLGAAYLQAGRRSEAVAEIRKAIEFNPAFKEQGEFFIKEIQAGRNP